MSKSKQPAEPDEILEFLMGFLLARGGSLSHSNQIDDTDDWYFDSAHNFTELRSLGLIGFNDIGKWRITQAGLDYIERGGKDVPA